MLPTLLREDKERDNAAGFVDILQTAYIQYELACRVLTPCFTVKTCDMQDWKGLIIGLLLPGMLVNAKVHDMLSDNILMFGMAT